MGTFVALEGENIGKEMGLIEGDAVLVFVVPLPENAQRIRAAVSPDRPSGGTGRREWPRALRREGTCSAGGPPACTATDGSP